MQIDQKALDRSAFRHALLVAVGLTALLFCGFYRNESGDMNVVVFGTFLYLPYVLLLTGYNAIALALLRYWTGPLGLLKLLLPLLPLIIWMIIAKGSITVRYWKLEVPEMTWILVVIGLLNCALLIRKGPEP